MSIQSDLLPGAIAARRYLGRKTKQWLFIWAVCAAVLVAVSVIRHKERNDIRHLASRLEERTQPLRKLDQERAQMERHVKEAQSRETWLSNADSNPALQLLGIISHASAENQGRVSVDNFQLRQVEIKVKDDKRSAAANGKSGKQAVREVMQLTLTGSAVDDLAVSSFVAWLRESEVFETVELRSSESVELNEHNARKYLVACVY